MTDWRTTRPSELPVRYGFGTDPEPACDWCGGPLVKDVPARRFCPGCPKSVRYRRSGPPRPRPSSAGARQRRLDREAAASGSATPEQLAARWDYYRGRCWMCGHPAKFMDHVKPLARGGCNWPSNQRPACDPCNRRKNMLWPYPTRAYSAGGAR